MSTMDGDEQPDEGIAVDARDWLVRLTSGSISRAELERFKSWRDEDPRHGAAFERERKFWDELRGLGPVIEPASLSLTRRSLLGGGLALAAASTYLVATPLSIILSADYIAPRGSQKDVDLPDGTNVSLNSGAALTVDYQDKIRLVRLLQGEAEFRIPSIVNGIGFRAAAGSGFSEMSFGRMMVSVAGDVTTVAVAEGTATVYCPVEADQIDLTNVPKVRVPASLQASYSKIAMLGPPHPADLEVLLAWRQGRIIFDGKPFGAAVDELGRYISEPIVLRPWVDRSIAVSGIFSVSDPLQGLRTLAKTQALSVRRIPNIAIILS